MSATSVQLLEWQTLGPDDPGSPLRGLTLRDEATRTLAAALTNEQILEVRELNSGLEIVTRAHVGRIQLGDLEITIQPKLAQDELLTLFRYAFDLDDFELRELTGFEVGEHLFQDLLAAQLLVEVSHLARRGLAKRYVAISEALSNPRGRIDFSRLARDLPLTEATLECRHHHRRLDHLLNQVLLAGVVLAAEISRHRETHAGLARLARRLETELSPIRLGFSTLGRAEHVIDRLTSAYAPPIRLTRLLLMGKCVSLNDGAVLELPGFLFDMNAFFEGLLERFLREHLVGFELVSQVGLSEMMRFTPGHNPRGARAPRPRPDFVLRRGRVVTGIFDAKYRDLWSRELPRDMLYQLAIYALSQQGPFDSAILYPTEDPLARDARIEIADPVAGRAAHGVVIRPVIISKLCEVLGNQSGASAREYARKLTGAHA